MAQTFSTTFLKNSASTPTFAFNELWNLKVIHREVKGRARFSVFGLKKNNHLKAVIEKQLCRIASVIKVEASTLTGNVLVIYDNQIDFEQILGFIKQNLEDLRQSGSTAKRPMLSTPAVEQRSSSIISRLRSFIRHKDANRFKVKHSNKARQPQEPWHQLERGRVLQILNSSQIFGLSHTEADIRLKQYGPNELQKSVIRKDMDILLRQLASWPVALLLGAAVVSVISGGLIDAVVIGTVILLNAGIGFVTEKEGEKAIALLNNSEPGYISVIREADPNNIRVSQLVPGDIVKLSPGDYIASDARLLKAHRLSVDESSLTGESLPVMKAADFIGTEFTPLADRKNMVYMGSMVTGGNGLAVIVNTAGYTELGTVQAMAGKAQSPETPMQNQLNALGMQLSLVAGGICILIFSIGIMRGFGILPMLKSAISLAVAAVPEGLPAIATTTLAIGIRNMQKDKVSARKIDAVETLGAVQVFCLDKTGTITMNHMTVVGAFINNEFLTLTPAGLYEQHTLKKAELMELHKVNVLCNETQLEKNGENFNLKGSATENALIEFAFLSDIDVLKLREEFPQLKIHYRSDGRQYIKTEHSLPDGRRYIAIKGSPTQLVRMCKWIMLDGKQLPMTEEYRALLLRENERMAGNSLRVLASVYAYSSGEERATEDEELVWIGMVGMQDPVRPGIKELMASFHNAGIETVMITGDQSATAYSVGKQLNLSNGKPLEILDSSNLVNVDPELLTDLVQKTHVFSRVSPANKLQIVQAFQRADKVVAMTGDGINDGPALKAANIGVAMGEGGAEIARSVADIVLEDNNLHTMVTAVEQGRTIYSNIRKTLHFLLATNLTEIEVMLAGVFLGKGNLLSPMQLLWINLISDVFPGLALSLEPAENNLMLTPPRDPKTKIIEAKTFAQIGLESATISVATLSSYSYGLMRYGAGLNANSISFMTLSLAQLLHAISCRSDTSTIYDVAKRPGNPYLNIALGGTVAAQFLLPLNPFVRRILGLSSFTLTDYAVIALGATAPLLINEANKKRRISKASPRNKNVSPRTNPSMEDELNASE